MKKKLYKAIQWFTDTVYGNDLACEEATFINSMLSSIFVNMLEDGTIIWDDEMVERAYPQAVGEVRRKEREKVINELRFMINDLHRRVEKDGK